MAEQNERWERIERGLEHLVQNAAKHDVWLAKHDVWLAKHDEWLAKHDEWLAKHDESCIRIDAAMEKMLDSQKHLLHAQVVFVDETRRSLDKLAESHRLTEEKMSHTDERLNALIATVDAIIRNQPMPPPYQQ